MTVMLYVQHLLGIGHLRRTAAIARAIAARGVAVHLISGGMPIPNLDIGSARCVQLPPIRAEDATYMRLVDARGREINDEFRQRRSQMLLDLFAQTKPAVLLVETFPFGRRMFGFELLPLLECALASQPKPAVVASIRDILEPKSKPGRNQEIVARVHKYFDLVLVHSDSQLVTLGSSFPLTTGISDQIRYTGYVSEQPGVVSGDGVGADEILVSTGGGVGGEKLLRVTLQTSLVPMFAGTRWRCLVGHNLSNTLLSELGAMAPEHVTIERNRSDFVTLLRNCKVSVSQAGYNTVAEALSVGTRSVLVPFADADEKEQTLRAGVIAEQGFATVVEAKDLNTESLARAITQALSGEPPAIAGVNLQGAENTAAIVVGLIAGGDPHGRGDAGDVNRSHDFGLK